MDCNPPRSLMSFVVHIPNLDIPTCMKSPTRKRTPRQNSPLHNTKWLVWDSHVFAPGREGMLLRSLKAVKAVDE